MIDDRGTGWGKSSRPGLWGGRRATGAFTRKIDNLQASRIGVPLRSTLHQFG